MLIFFHYSKCLPYLASSDTTDTTVTITSATYKEFQKNVVKFRKGTYRVAAYIIPYIMYYIGCHPIYEYDQEQVA